MVDDTGIEPVTSPMSRERATAALIVRTRRFEMFSQFRTAFQA